MLLGVTYNSCTAQSLSNANRLVSRADKRVIAYYYNYRCAYINETVAESSYVCMCARQRIHMQHYSLQPRQGDAHQRSRESVPQPATVRRVGLNTQMQVDRLSVCACARCRRRRHTARAVCGDIRAVGAAGAPSPARSPRYAAANTAASASLNNKTRSMAGVFLPI